MFTTTYMYYYTFETILLDADSTKSMVSMEIPKLYGSFTGAGDLFAALLLAWMTRTDGDLRVSPIPILNQRFPNYFSRGAHIEAKASCRARPTKSLFSASCIWYLMHLTHNTYAKV